MGEIDRKYSKISGVFSKSVSQSVKRFLFCHDQLAYNKSKRGQNQ